MLSKRVFLASQYSGEWRQKGFMDSMSPPQIQIVFIASLKPCLNLYSLRWLKLRRNLVNSFIPYGLWISKMLLGEGLINSKSSLLLWWDRYIRSRKRMSLKFTGELCVMTMKNDAHFEEKFTYHSGIIWKLAQGIWQILTWTLKSLRNFTSFGFF